MPACLQPCAGHPGLLRGEDVDGRGKPELAAISAVALRYSAISNALATAPERFKPIFRPLPGRGADVRPWCQGFHAAMKLRLLAWSQLLDFENPHHALLLAHSALLHRRAWPAGDPRHRPSAGEKTPPRRARRHSRRRACHPRLPAAQPIPWRVTTAQT
jgi:uncharacterized protein